MFAREFGNFRTFIFSGRIVFLIVHYLPDQTIQPGEFEDGIFLVRFLVEKVFVPVQDHAELRAPIADVIVAYHVMAQESQRAAERVADDRRADVAHVHGLGHVGSGKIDDVGPRSLDQRDPQARMLEGVVQQPNEPFVSKAKVDESRPGDLGRMTNVGHVQVAENICRHVSGRALKRLAKGMAKFAW